MSWLYLFNIHIIRVNKHNNSLHHFGVNMQIIFHLTMYAAIGSFHSDLTKNRTLDGGAIKETVSKRMNNKLLAKHFCENCNLKKWFGIIFLLFQLRANYKKKCIKWNTSIKQNAIIFMFINRLLVFVYFYFEMTPGWVVSQGCLYTVSGSNNEIHLSFLFLTP